LTVQINQRKVEIFLSVKVHQEKSPTTDGWIDRNDEEFGSVVRYLKPSMADGPGLEKCDEVFLIANEHRRWLMG